MSHGHGHGHGHGHVCMCTRVCTCACICGGLGERGGGGDARGVIARDGGQREGGGDGEAAVRLGLGLADPKPNPNPNLLGEVGVRAEHGDRAQLAGGERQRGHRVDPLCVLEQRGAWVGFG